MRSLLALLFSASVALADPVSLFDGKSLDGWDFNPQMWRVEEGVITGGSTTEKIKANDFISTKKSYQNFELKLKIKVSGDPKTGMLNSGIQIRSIRQGGGMSGYQIDCGEGWFGKIYDEHRRNKVIAEPLDAAALAKVVDVFGWNEYRIRAEGPRIQAWINGVHCIDYTEQDPNIALDGHIAPQVHSGGVCLVQVKDISIEELPATPGAPTWKSVKPTEHGKPNTNKPKRDISYNDVQGSALTAQEQLKKFHLPDDYEMELVVQESEGLGKFVSVYFDQRGRMWTQTALEYPIDANENPAAADAIYAGKGKDKVLVYSRDAINGDIPDSGLSNPTVFADGLAIPLGILPWGNGDTCYVQHGHDLKVYKDTNGDGKADTFDVQLTGFGVQDSHLFPHQFTRAPGGWIWMAQGLFNNSSVHKPGSDKVVDWAKCSMARMRPDGSEFEVISTGPNNIWGLVITGEGEAFIQEANDYGYPVMPFHEYAYYPGGMEALKKSYQPDFPPAAEFRMGGTGLSGLALIEGGSLRDKKAAHSMAVANPITSKIQTIAMHRDGQYWKLEQLPDLVTCDDPFFRPVALTNGPDGCIYIVDWYNKIISHNEVPRAHPDRDKTRGRIWRMKPEGMKTEVQDFSQQTTEQLTAMLGKEPVAAAHIAWQTLADRNEPAQAHWSSAEYAFPQTSAEIRRIGRNLPDQSVGELLQYAKPSISGPTAASSRGPKQIPVREAYDREYERFLVRMFLERQPEFTAKFLDSPAAAQLPTEALVLASLALEPKASASRVAKLLPKLDRSPNDEELLRLAQFPGEPGVGDALKVLLAQPATVEKLLSHKTKLDPAQVAPLLTDAARTVLKDNLALGLQLISGFQLAALEPELVAMVKQQPADLKPLLFALRDLRSAESELFTTLAKSEPAALEALAASRAPDAAERLLSLAPQLTAGQRRTSFSTLSSSKAGAKGLVAALAAGQIKADDLDGPAVERLATVLSGEPELKILEQKLGGVFHEVLALDGSDPAWVDSKITLDGPFTVECWVRLAPDITNADSLLGSKGQLDMNFFGSTFRVWLGDGVADVAVSKKPITPDLWTHLAVTRDGAGAFKIYQNGELDAEGSKSSTAKFDNCKIGWSGPNKGTEGMITEFRVWKLARSAAEIRAHFDRSGDSVKWKSMPLGKGARLAKTTDYPPILSAEQAAALDAKFAKFTALAHKPGNATTGKALAAICLACHQIGNEGGQIGPNLSGAGAMGLEAVLRNILTPNAAMEPGYRIFRVEMKNGDLVDAFYVSEDATALVVRQPGLADRRIAKNEVQRTSYIRRSLMPEGLIDGLSDSQISDLFTYLMSLKK